ncbi:MAG: ChbG/HpnK family deacetylase [Methylobacteriaceae bacterium]|nr:ChbG/HpnK family deacetylase [Methylobacteriaceae bacterium]
MAAPAPFRFVLCADDYALSPAVSAGILAALAAGALTATGVMTTRPSWPAAARALDPFREHADIGLHFNLTLGAPLGPAPQLAPDGVFPKVGAVIARALRGALPRGEIAAELDRQLDAFVAAAGGPPDFVDGHQHVHALPGLRDILFEALARRGWAGRLWLRDPADRAARLLARKAMAPKAATLAGLARGFGAAARRAGFSVNDGFAGFSDFAVDRDYAALFATFLRAPGPRHLVMCHPGRVDDELVALDPVTTGRERELGFLLSPDFARVCAAAGAAPARFAAAGQG